MKAVFFFQLLFSTVFILLVTVKTVHFSKNIRHKKLQNWFYFTRYHIILSSTTASANAKKKQNAFTMLLAAVAIMLIATLLISK